MNVLVTGAAGYIGSHACKRLLAEGHTVLALDSLDRGHRRALDLLNAPDRLEFVEARVGDEPRVTRLLAEHRIDTVMHFAALAYVGESVEQPLRYYSNNVAEGLALLRACEATGVQRFVFSSSCATYGDPPPGMIPVPETCPQHPTSPYGWTKLILEHALLDWAAARAAARRPIGVALLRYFNVAGADAEGVLGEDHDPETHLVPVAIRATRPGATPLSLFGTDYPTPDGTCVRDYVHVDDLADAHALVMSRLQPGDTLAYNVGLGRGYSVREVIAAVEQATGRKVPVVEKPRRPGDAVALYADPTKIMCDLAWAPRHTDIVEIVASAAHWFEANPNGYAD
ncbi:MAG: UDP-glucose 4-epimerase GalE [Phycisphaerales bacterium]